MVTLRDIAHMAGCSVGTVSRALKQQAGLTEQTRQQVMAVAERLGYDTTRLRHRKVNRLAFLLHRQHSSLAQNPFFSPVLSGVEAACREAGIVPSVLTLDPGEPIRERLQLHDPDVLLCAGYIEPEVLATLQTTGKPLVLVDAWARDLPSINADHYDGARQAVSHLLQTGCRRVAMLAGSLAHYSIRERVRGYRKALFDARVLADPDLEIVLEPSANPAESAMVAMQQLMSRPDRPDAIFAYNDTTALACLHACQLARLRVPEDVSVVGFDDILQASHASPALTTLRVDKEKLGRAGVSWLLSGQADVEHRILPVELVCRSSTRSVASPVVGG
ncbi:DNA-binding LacI/PurR family transcriptional regulator [Chitinivorax tropicus]|uniref:DNA-binding LacI/PurR family transcriptional regulator n=1 Tax=Chitinivorax tropicus TaxID=714531 RepID=A0A840MNF0_9PROT|nr:LacI family DNA-binding transcriptional regulator [Chitinivorax tropicus]MBB5018995.1 DNA-binding LacI/PurR family transcriptional regulator [Chitinivorax tropicus]